MAEPLKRTIRIKPSKDVAFTLEEDDELDCSGPERSIVQFPATIHAGTPSSLFCILAKSPFRELAELGAPPARADSRNVVGIKAPIIGRDINVRRVVYSKAAFVVINRQVLMYYLCGTPQTSNLLIQ